MIRSTHQGPMKKIKKVTMWEEHLQSFTGSGHA
jgi:hypothetical protein